MTSPSSKLLLDILGTELAWLLAGSEHFLLATLVHTGLLPFVRNLEFGATHIIPSSNEAYRTFRICLSVLRQTRYLSDQSFRQFVTTNVNLASAIAAVRDGSVAVGAARLCAIKAYIVETFTDQQLSLGRVALTQRITPRYVRKLFEAEGTTFSEYVLTLRLMRAYEMLSDPNCADMPVTNIAFAAGFGDLSYFDRTFRRRFGATPSGVRQSASRHQTAESNESE
jgi:AraC-like DNA-binding protein